jgi:hypothetical protein
MNKLTDQKLMRLKEDLRVILNRNGVDSISNTPDFLLAELISYWIMDYIDIICKRDLHSVVDSATGELGEVGNG